MKFKVLKSFQSDGKMLERGVVIDIPSTRRTQTLIETRYLLPTDEEIAEQTKTPEQAGADSNVARQNKRRNA